MEQKTRYELHRDYGNGFQKALDCPSIEKAEEYARNEKSREEQHFKIVAVTTIYTELKPFSVAAYIPDWTDVAIDMASVYAQSIDWQNEDFLALSEEDQAKAREYIEDSTDDCEHCGWTFEYHYLSDTNHGRICGRCESDLEDEDESDED